MIVALDARTRLDYGTPLPGDNVLAAIFDRHCQWEAQRFDDRLRGIEYADWLARQCGGCEPGGGGDECDDHWAGEVTA